MNKNRETNLDALRILAMLLIILLHSIDHSGVLEKAQSSINAYTVYVMFCYALSEVCINCFVLITGYFQINKKFKLNNLISLWAEAVFYSLLFKVVFMAKGDIPFSLKSLVSCLVPVFTGRYWFLTIYFGLYILSPFLNIAVHAMNSRQLKNLNIVLFILLCLWSSVHPAFKGMNVGEGWGLAWFVALYITGAWFRLNYQKDGIVLRKIFGNLLSAGLLALLFVVSRSYVTLNRIILLQYKYNSVPVYIASLLLFAAFINIEIRNDFVNRILVTLSSTTFGIYLIHAHANVSPWIWETLNLPALMDGNLMTFVFMHIASVILVFISCAVISLLRSNVVRRLNLRRFLGDNTFSPEDGL